MRMIKGTIGLDGKITLDVHGVQGPGCADLTKALEAALGEVEERHCKLEYNQPPKVVQQQKVTGR